MASGYSSWLKRKILYKIPGLYKKCPDGNYHFFTDRICYCMYGESSGDKGGVYDFKYNHWIKGTIIENKG